MQVGQKVAWAGDPTMLGTSDGPCKNGRCIGTVLNPLEHLGSYIIGANLVHWGIECEGHKGSPSPELVNSKLLREETE